MNSYHQNFHLEFPSSQSTSRPNANDLIVFLLLLQVTGRLLDVSLGLLMLPVSKNSVLQLLLGKELLAVPIPLLLRSPLLSPFLLLLSPSSLLFLPTPPPPFPSSSLPSHLASDTFPAFPHPSSYLLPPPFLLPPPQASHTMVLSGFTSQWDGFS